MLCTESQAPSMVIQCTDRDAQISGHEDNSIVCLQEGIFSFTHTVYHHPTTQGVTVANYRAQGQLDEASTGIRLRIGSQHLQLPGFHQKLDEV